MSEQQTPEPHPYLAAHLAKHTYRALLPVFAHIWSQAREAALPDSLNAALWPGYERVLRACQDVLSDAPMHPNECRQANIETRYDRAIERLVTTLVEIFPGGMKELESYIATDALRAKRRLKIFTRARNEKENASQTEGEGNHE